MRKLKFLGFAVAAVLCAGLVSCSEDKKDEPQNGIEEENGLFGWYTDLDDFPVASDFDEINEAIRNREVLAEFKKIDDIIATYDLFVDDDGAYSDSSSSCYRLRWTISDKGYIVVRIVNENTLVIYSSPFAYGLYVDKDGRGEGDVIYRLYGGPIFGNMTYYGDPQYYTYVKNGNKIIVSNGDIFTITSSSGLIKDGSSSVLSKYDPSKRY